MICGNNYNLVIDKEYLTNNILDKIEDLKKEIEKRQDKIEKKQDKLEERIIKFEEKITKKLLII